MSNAFIGSVGLVGSGGSSSDFYWIFALNRFKFGSILGSNSSTIRLICQTRFFSVFTDFWGLFSARFASFLGAFGDLGLGFCSFLKIRLNASGMGQGGKRKGNGRKSRQGKGLERFWLLWITFS